MGTVIPTNHPFIGDDANRTRAGIHGHGLYMDERIYQIFDTTALLGTPPTITITDKSGMQGILFWAQCYLAETVAERTDIIVKRTRLVQVAKWVSHQYDELGRTTGISDDELAGQLLLHLPEAAVPAYVNKAHGLTGEARASADDCAPIIAALQDLKKAKKLRAKEQHTNVPSGGVSSQAMQKLMAEHLDHLYR